MTGIDWGIDMTLQIEAQRPSSTDELLERIADELVPKPEPQQTDALDEWLDATLCNELGLASVARDDDGDIPIAFDGTVVYVRSGGAEASFLTVLALLLEDFDVTPEVYEAVNAINVQVPMAKTIVDVEHHQIVTSVELPVVDTLSPHDLMLAVDIVTDAADYFATLLQDRFGGATARDA
jgi:hypothetical protein